MEFLLLSVFWQQQIPLHKGPHNPFRWKPGCTQLLIFLAMVYLQRACTESPGFFSHFPHSTSGHYWVLSWKTVGDGWRRSCFLLPQIEPKSLQDCGWCEAVLSNSLETGVPREVSSVLASGNRFLFALLIPGWEQQAPLHLLQSPFRKEITAILIAISYCNSSLLLSTLLFLWVYLKTSLSLRCHFSPLLCCQQSKRLELDHQLWNVSLWYLLWKANWLDVMGWLWWAAKSSQLLAHSLPGWTAKRIGRAKVIKLLVWDEGV